MSDFPIDNIVIGDRARKDMGGLQTLAESMKRHGLLHPVVVKRDSTLVAGHRRIEAARLNGWTEIAVTVVDVDDLLSAERDENAERKDFTPSEAAAIAYMIEEKERPKALERLRAGRKNSKALGKTPRGHYKSVEDIAAEAVGMSRQTYHKAKAVVSAAESNPEKFGDLAEQMDATGNVSAAHREMERRKGTANGTKVRHPVHRKTRYPKPNREMERALPALDGICDCLEALKPEELDTSKRNSWAKGLKKIVSRLNNIARRIHDDKA